MLLAGDIFHQSGRCDVWQPVEDRVAQDTGDPAVSIEVRPRDFIGIEFQYQVERQTSPAGSPRQVLGQSITIGRDASPKTFIGWKSLWHRRSPSGISARPLSMNRSSTC